MAEHPQKATRASTRAANNNRCHFLSNLQIIFSVNHLVIKMSEYCIKKNSQYNFPDPKLTYLNRPFCQIISQKPKHIYYTIVQD